MFDIEADNQLSAGNVSYIKNDLVHLYETPKEPNNPC